MGLHAWGQFFFLSVAVNLASVYAADYYSVLGVGPDAQSQQIKQAYRKLSLKWHPDRNQKNSEVAHDKFIEIGEAYSILSDSKKKTVYDQFGKQGLDRDEAAEQAKAHEEATAHEKAKSEHFRQGSKISNDLFGSSVPGVEELDDASWKEMLEDNAERRSVIVVFYEPGCAVCPSIKTIFAEFAEKLAVPGLFDVAAVNCGTQKQRCENLFLPTVMYYGPENARPVAYQTGAVLSFPYLSTWSLQMMSDYSHEISDEYQLNNWLSSDDSLPKVILFSDMTSTPPLWKAMSVEFLRRASLGIVLARNLGGKSLRDRLKVTQMPSIIHIEEERTLDGTRLEQEIERELLSQWLSRAVGRHRTNAATTVTELTASRLRSGICAEKDSQFCFILISVFPGATQRVHDTLNGVAKRLKKDPVRMFYAKDPNIVASFGPQKPGTLILYRPKRKRFQIYPGLGNVDVDQLSEWVGNEVCCGFQLPFKLFAPLVV